MALLGCLAVWFLVIRDDSSGTVPAAGAGPRLASQEDLRALAGEVGHPIYWAGPQNGEPIEVTRTGNGQIYLRYLAPGAEPGDPRPEFLTVGTYPTPDATETLELLAEADGALTAKDPDGGLVVTNEQNPYSVYLADSSGEVQVEVYDADPARAFKLARRGEILPVG